MAKKTVVIDDISGEPNAKSYTFALNGEEFEIDLTEQSFSKLSSALEPYMEAGAKVTKRAPRSSSESPKSNREELQAARAWWREQGNQIADRGRVPNSVLEAYREAH